MCVVLGPSQKTKFSDPTLLRYRRGARHLGFYPAASVSLGVLSWKPRFEGGRKLSHRICLALVIFLPSIQRYRVCRVRAKFVPLVMGRNGLPLGNPSVVSMHLIFCFSR